MDIAKLKKHLEETPLEKLKEEWKEVKDFENVGPTVITFLESIVDKNKIKEKILKLKVFHQAENAWEDTKWKPFSRKLIEIDKVLEILDE